MSVEPFHLFRYLDEQSFRYNNRKDMNDGDRFSLAVSQIVGKRVTYNQFNGKSWTNAGVREKAEAWRAACAQRASP